MDYEETETLLKDMEDVPTSQVLEVFSQPDFRLFLLDIMCNCVLFY